MIAYCLLRISLSWRWYDFWERIILRFMGVRLMKKRNVAILLFDEVEVLDFAGPFEVFAVTSELNDYEPLKVYTVAEKKQPIRARNGLSVNPDYGFDDCPAPDILIVPGGEGTRAVMKNQAALDWIKTVATGSEMTLSVCTGALVLGEAGLLDGLAATTHHETFDLLRKIAPKTTVRETDRFVDNGKVITSGGISAGIDMSLHVIWRLLGEEQAQRTAEYMEYGDWRKIKV